MIKHFILNVYVTSSPFAWYYMILVACNLNAIQSEACIACIAHVNYCTITMVGHTNLWQMSPHRGADKCNVFSVQY